MRRSTRLTALFLFSASLLCAVIVQGQEAISDGSDEVLAVIDAKPVTYQEVVGHLDLAAEIRARRAAYPELENKTDAEIEREIVYAQLDTFLIRRLLTAEADRIKFHISDGQLRGILANERKLLGIAEDDQKAWAEYVQAKFGLTPSEYRERRREEVRQQQLLYLMSGAQGSVPTQYPISVYFPLSVTPRDIRLAFEKERENYRVATDIDYRELTVWFPSNVSLNDRRKLWEVLQTAHQRTKAGESLESASDGLKRLVEELAVPGLRLEVGERATAADDSGLDATSYQMVLSVPAKGGVSEIGAVRDTDESGNEYDGYRFVKLFSRVDGDARDFHDPFVQRAIEETLWNQRLQENMARVQQALLEKAVIVPERLIPR